MFTATMSDTGESITGGTDMLSGILSIVYWCEYIDVLDSCEYVESTGKPATVHPHKNGAPIVDNYHWTIAKA